MKIEIDLDRIRKLALSPTDFVYLYAHFHKLTVLANEWVYPERQTRLEKEGWIKITSSGLELREKAYKLFEVADNDKAWIEFFMEFPMKVPDTKGAGYRPLRAVSLDAKSNANIKKKYLGIIVGKPELHNHIINVLKLEVADRRRSGSLPYMNAIEAWLNQRVWEKYEFLLNQDKPVERTKRIE